jgi:hypothetical protein
MPKAFSIKDGDAIMPIVEDDVPQYVLDAIPGCVGYESSDVNSNFPKGRRFFKSRLDALLWKNKELLERCDELGIQLSELRQVRDPVVSEIHEIKQREAKY